MPIYLKTNLLFNYNFIFNLLDCTIFYKITIYIYIVNYNFLFIEVYNITN